MIFPFLSFDETQELNTRCMFLSCGKNVKNKVKWNLDPESLIDAPVQPAARFWSFKLEEQRAGTTFTICVETFNCYFLLCFVLSVQRRRHPLFSFKESMGSWFESE